MSRMSAFSSGAVLTIVLAIAMAVAFSAPLEAKKRKTKLCKDEHFHYGSSEWLPTRKRAMADAVASWASFTSFEYGNAWARFSLAHKKKTGCERGGPSGKSWYCAVEGIPCRR